MSTQQVDYAPPESDRPRVDARRSHGPELRWRIAIPGIALIWIVGMIDKTGVGVIAANDTFLSALHLEGRDTLIGWLTTITLMFYGASMPVWGLLIDRVGPRRCAMGGLVFWAISTAICGIAGSVGVLLVGRAMLGVAEGFLWPLSNALTARWFPRSERSRAKAIWIGGINIGFAASGYVINGAIGATDWRGAFFLLSILAVVVCLPAAYFLIHDDPARVPSVSQDELDLITAHGEETRELTAEQKRALLTSWPYLIVVLVWIANNMAVFGLASWFPTYLKTQHVSHDTTSLFIALAFVLCLVVTPFVAIGMDRTGRKAHFLLGGFAIAAIMLLIAATVHDTAIEIAAVIVAIAGIEGATTIAGQGVLHSMAPARLMGRSAGVMIGIGNFVGAFGTLIMGALIDAGGFTLAFTFLIGVFVVGGGCAIALNRLSY